MKKINRIISCILLLIMILTNIRIDVYAANLPENIISLDNGYIKYTLNKKTGGFSIHTLKGHPQKKYDDNIPLLYQDDRNSTETSFTTVRIDGEDYIFGQDYGWLNMKSKLYEPVVNKEENTIITKWVINNIEVTQKIALSSDPNNDLAGNAGIVYEIKNIDGEVHRVGIRTLLDSALDTIDSPYMMAGYDSIPTVTEREFSGKDVPDQIRGMDSLENTSIMSYAILKGWSDGSAPDKAIIGHWANLADTKYDYTPNPSCNFSNNSNEYRTADSALAFYWNEEALGSQEVRKSEFLYGVGNFSQQLITSNLNINIDMDRVYVTEDKSSYKNEGIFEVRAEIDNTVDNASDILNATLGITLEKGLSIVGESKAGETSLVTGESVDIDYIPKGSTVSYYWRIKAEPQTTITAKEVSVNLYTNSSANAQARRYVILPSVKGNIPDIVIDGVTPEKYYFGGDKNITISGKLEAFKSLSGKSGWDVFLIHKISKESIKIDKSKIAFIGENFTSMSLSTDEDLDLGLYEIVFKFNDHQLTEEFTSEIKLMQNIEVNNDERYKGNSYGIVTAVRYEKTKYKLVTFKTEEELKAYKKKYELEKYDSLNMEMLLEVKGPVRESKNEKGEIYYTVNPGESEVIINNIVQYSGSEPLILSAEGEKITVSGDGKISVINEFTFWNSGFDITLTNGSWHTLEKGKIDSYLAADEDIEEVIIEYLGIGKLIQNIGGATVDLKYGVLTESWDDEVRDGYAINFGGKILLSFLSPAEDSSTKGTEDNDKPKPEPKPGEEEDDDKDDEPEKISVGADIENILFGESEDKVEFLGINATAQFSLPKGALGGFIENPPGLQGLLTINTLDNIYAIEAGVKMFVLECTGTLQIKIIDVNDMKFPVPDSIGFSIGGMEIPLVPPNVSITALRGGYSDLADTITGNSMQSMPPLTLKIGTDLKVVQVLEGEFDMAISLNGIDLTGKLALKKVKDFYLEAGLNAQWTDPWHVNLYGNISVFEIIKGGISVSISKDYFFGYGYVEVSIPKKIPIVGGKKLAGVEAAVSNQMIGLNVEVLSFKYGVVYYWSDGEVIFSDTLDLSKKSRMLNSMYIEETPFGSKTEESVGYYGTNIRAVKAETVEEPRVLLKDTLLFNSNPTSSKSKTVTGITGSDALLFEIKYRSDDNKLPTINNIQVKNPNGNILTLKEDKSLDGGEEGNFLIQDLGDEGKYIFLSVTDNDSNIDRTDGTWTVSSLEEKLIINDFNVKIVDNIPELTSLEVSTKDLSKNKIDLAWGFDSDSINLEYATVNAYLTENKDGIKNNLGKNPEDLGILIGTFKATDKKAQIEIPDTLKSSTYYVVAVLNLEGSGPDIKVSETPILFNNAKLPLNTAEIL